MTRFPRVTSAPPRAVALLVAGAALWTSTTACCLFADRDAAVSVIEEVRSATTEHEKQTRAAIVALCDAYLSEVKLRLEAQAEARWARLRTEVEGRIVAKQIELRRVAESELEKALDPTLVTLQRDLEAEKIQVRERIAPNRERELALASQLSSTLAIGQREAEKLKLFVDEQLLVVRTSVLEQIDTAAATVRVSFDPAVEASRAVDEWAASDPYLDGLARALDELRRYAQTDDAMTLFLKGLVGENLGAKLGGLIQAKAKGLADGFADKLDASVDRSRAAAEQTLAQAAADLGRSGR